MYISRSSFVKYILRLKVYYSDVAPFIKGMVMIKNAKPKKLFDEPKICRTYLNHRL